MALQVVLQSELPEIQSCQIIAPSLVFGFRNEDFGLFRPPWQILNFGCQLYTNLSLGLTSEMGNFTDSQLLVSLWFGTGCS